jgi:hypothetical protein
MTVARARAKSRILAWFDKRQPDQKERQRFAHDIDLFFETVAARSQWCECLSTLLDDKGLADFTMAGRDWRARPSGAGLVVSSIVPGWNFGWHTILKDEVSYDILSRFGHHARQYIHRSNIAKVLMAAWERNGLILHPFGEGVLSQRYSDREPRSTNREIFTRAEQFIAVRWKEPAQKEFRSYRSNWAKRNTLDPAIHQGIFHFLRAQSLVAAGFEMEALTAYDCVLQALQSLDWSWAPGNPSRSRSDMCRAMGFGAPTVSLADQVYFLRNQFVAHAGGWRWWDAVEYLEDDLTTRVSAFSLRALRKAADLEPLQRRLAPEPDDWASWLEENFAHVWAATWFREA